MRRVVLVTLLYMSVVLVLITFAGIAYVVLNIAILHWYLVLQHTFPSRFRYMKGLVGFSVTESTTAAPIGRPWLLIVWIGSLLWTTMSIVLFRYANISLIDLITRDFR